jgi:hypothetical protein
MPHADNGDTMNTSPNFVVFPYALLDSVAEGDTTPSMLLTLAYLHRHADPETGTVKHVTARNIVSWYQNSVSFAAVTTALQRLEALGRISRAIRNGSIRPYTVIIHNFPKIDTEIGCDDADPGPGTGGTSTYHAIKGGVINERRIKTLEEVQGPEMTLEAI